MTKPLHPALKKGHRFSIDWPPGFEPQPYIKPHPLAKDGDRDLLMRCTGMLKGRDALNKMTGRKYYGKKLPMVIVYEDIFIRQLAALCGKIRFLLSRWPANKGGKISYKTSKIRR